MLNRHSEAFEDCVRGALNVDNAIWRAGAAGPSRPAGGSGRAPMKLENAETGSRRDNQAQHERRQKDLKKRACFIYHKAGCRPWKHRAPEMNSVDDEGKSATESSESDREPDSKN